MPPHRQPAVRLLIVPGLNDSGPAHWQTWLERLHDDAVRVRQTNWAAADLDRWAQSIGSTMDACGDTRWAVAAHSFGCLALARLVALRPDVPIEAALLVAPADPDRFGAGEALPSHPLPFPSTLIGSQNDPWLSAAKAQAWAQRWQSRYVDLGMAGHINAEAGFGPLPMAQRWVLGIRRRAERAQRAAGPAMLERGSPPEGRGGPSLHHTT